MVDPQAARVAQVRTDHVDERPVAALAQQVRDERRQAPVLALRPERVGRRAGRRGVGVEVLPEPDVEALGGHADGQVVDHPDLAAVVQRLELLVDQQLDVGLALDGVGVPRGERGHRRAVRVAQLLGPLLPAGALLLPDRAERRERVQVVGRRAVHVEVRSPSVRERRVAQLEGLSLEPVHLVAQDQRLGLQGPAGRGELLEALPLRAAERPGLGHVLEPHVQRVAEDPADRGVRARLLRERRADRVQRVDEGERGPRLEPRERGHVGQLADPPRPRRAQRVQLQREAEGPPAVGQPRRQVAGVGRHDQLGSLAAPADHRVVAGRQVGGDRAVLQAALRAVLEQHARRPGRPPRRRPAAAGRDESGPGIVAGPLAVGDPHRREHAAQRRLGRLDPLAGSPEPSLHTEAFRAQAKLVQAHRGTISSERCRPIRTLPRGRPAACGRAGPTLSGRTGTAPGRTSRCSPSVPRRSTCASSRAVTRCACRCAGGPPTPGTATAPGSAPASATATGPTARTRPARGCASTGRSS